MTIVAHDQAPTVHQRSLRIVGVPRDDVSARVMVGVVSVLTFALAAYLTAIVAGGLLLGTSVVRDATFDLALAATWTAGLLGLVATRWLYAPDRIGSLARFAAIVAVSLLVVAAVSLASVGAVVPFALALLLAAVLAWLAARRGDFA
jgi:hypothetical protein